MGIFKLQSNYNIIKIPFTKFNFHKYILCLDNCYKLNKIELNIFKNINIFNY